MSSGWLNDHKKNVHSQNGEDGVLEVIFGRIGEGKKWACEFGAADGIWFSNTHNLVANRDWSAVLIEPQLELETIADGKQFVRGGFLKLKTNMERFERVIAINALVMDEGQDTLDNILGRTPVPRDFDLLSIDVDSNDYWIWRSLKNYQPRVVVIETCPPRLDVRIITQRGGGGGTSPAPMVELGKEKGYELACFIANNAFFVLREYVDQLNIDTDHWQELINS